MLLGGMESGATILENSLAVPQIIKYRVILKKMKTYIHTKTYTRMVITELFTKISNNPNDWQLMNEQTKHAISIHWNIVLPQYKE